MKYEQFVVYRTETWKIIDMVRISNSNLNQTKVLKWPPLSETSSRRRSKNLWTVHSVTYESFHREAPRSLFHLHLLLWITKLLFLLIDCLDSSCLTLSSIWEELRSHFGFSLFDGGVDSISFWIGCSFNVLLLRTNQTQLSLHKDVQSTALLWFQTCFMRAGL